MPRTATPRQSAFEGTKVNCCRTARVFLGPPWAAEAACTLVCGIGPHTRTSGCARCLLDVHGGGDQLGPPSHDFDSVQLVAYCSYDPDSCGIRLHSSSGTICTTWLNPQCESGCRLETLCPPPQYTAPNQYQFISCLTQVDLMRLGDDLEHFRM